MSKWIPFDSGGGLTGTGNWSDANHWDAGVPDSTHDTIFDANSFNGAGQTVTVNATAGCKDMDWTGATNTPTLATGTQALNCYGNCTFIAAMVTTGTTGIVYFVGSGTITLITNGLTLNFAIGSPNALTGTWSWGSNITITKDCYFNGNGATITTNNYNLDCASVTITGSLARTLTLGSSIINCSAWIYSGSNLTVSANTATINDSGNFSGGSLVTYYILNLTGATSTVTGNNKMAKLGLNPAAAQTITNTGYTQVMDALTRTGTGLITFVGGTYRKSGGGQLNRLAGSKFRHNQFKIPFKTAFLYKGY